MCLEKTARYLLGKIMNRNAKNVWKLIQRPGRVDNSPYCAKIKRTDTSLLRFIICNKGNDLHLHQIMKHASLILAVMRRIIRRAVSIIIFSLLFSASYLSYNMTRNI